MFGFKIELNLSKELPGKFKMFKGKSFERVFESNRYSVIGVQCFRFSFRFFTCLLSVFE